MSFLAPRIFSSLSIASLYSFASRGKALRGFSSEPLSASGVFSASLVPGSATPRLVEVSRATCSELSGMGVSELSTTCILLSESGRFEHVRFCSTVAGGRLSIFSCRFHPKLKTLPILDLRLPGSIGVFPFLESLISAVCQIDGPDRSQPREQNSYLATLSHLTPMPPRKG